MWIFQEGAMTDLLLALLVLAVGAWLALPIGMIAGAWQRRVV
jgi:hypothetical protein